MLLAPTRTIMIGGAPQPLKVPLTQTVLTPGMNVLLAIWLAMSTRNVTNVLACDADADATSQTTHSALARFVIFSTASLYPNCDPFLTAVGIYSKRADASVTCITAGRLQ